MYYTIEGKRLLIVLYFAGVLLGALIINIGIQKGIFHFYDFLDYTGYITSLEENTGGEILSYVLYIRIRQVILFIIGMFILTPYVTYCVFTGFLALTLGSFVSLLVIRFGWTGIIYCLVFGFPQSLFYIITLVTAYSYIFGSKSVSSIYRMRVGKQGALIKIRSVMDHKVFVSGICIASFVTGCFSEAYFNPMILKNLLNSM